MTDNSTVPPDLGTAFTRTVVPYLAAFIVTKLAKNGVNADIADVSAAIVTLGGSAWYTIVRVAEQRWPQAGWLLGSPKKPTYKKS